MAFNLRIKNFERLSDAEIRIGQFTVFAGPNNTGKSSVSKLLYSLFNAMNVGNHALAYFDDLTYGLRRKLSSLERSENGNRESPLHALDDGISSIEAVFKSPSFDSLEEAEEQWGRIIACTGRLRETYSESKLVIEKMLSEQEDSRRSPSEHLDDIEEELEKLCKTIENSTAGKFVDTGLQQNIFRSLTENFQVRNLSFLRAQPDELSEVHIDGIGSFELSDSRDISFRIERYGFEQLQDYSKVIYLESPVYWKLKSALDTARMSSRFLRRNRGRPRTVPGYFYDLAWALIEEPEDDIVFAQLYEKLTSKQVVGGRLAISKTGELSFQENERSLSLYVTAMGVINIGFLALLIERNIIDDGTFLFVDEPEAHLHPAWQVEIVKTLLELSKSGVHVVMATHSMSIMKFLQVKAKKDPQIKELIALNHFSSDGIENRGDDFDSVARNILIELTEPYSELYMEGL